MDRGLRIQETLPEIADQLDVRFPVDAPKIGDRCGRRRFDLVEKAFPLQTLDDGPETVRPLHMEGRWDMIQETRIVHDHDPGEGRGRFQGIVRPTRPAGGRSFDERCRGAKVFSARSKLGIRAGNPPDPARGPPTAPSSRVDGPPSMREMVLGPADYPIPRPGLS